MTDKRCIGCPFRKDCPGCPWQGGTIAAQSDSRAEVRQESGVSWDNGGEQGAAPERCVNTAEGLTVTQLPTRPGGIVAEAMLPTHAHSDHRNAQIGAVR